MIDKILFMAGLWMSPTAAHGAPAGCTPSDPMLKVAEACSQIDVLLNAPNRYLGSADAPDRGANFCFNLYTMSDPSTNEVTVYRENEKRILRVEKYAMNSFGKANDGSKVFTIPGEARCFTYDAENSGRCKGPQNPLNMKVVSIGERDFKFSPMLDADVATAGKPGASSAVNYEAAKDAFMKDQLQKLISFARRPNPRASKPGDEKHAADSYRRCIDHLTAFAQYKGVNFRSTPEAEKALSDLDRKYPRRKTDPEISFTTR